MIIYEQGDIVVATRWPSDVPIAQIESCGLTYASVIRMKCFTLEDHLIKRRIGRLAPADLVSIKNRLQEITGL